jgi:hypothetical protein
MFYHIYWCVSSIVMNIVCSFNSLHTQYALNQLGVLKLKPFLSVDGI